MQNILLVVEGEGEVEAARVLASRVLVERNQLYDWSFVTHRRGGITNLQASEWGNFRRFLLAAYKEDMPILWMLDNDEGVCARALIKEFYAQIYSVGIRQPLAFSLWKREYETLFLYDSENVSKKLGCAEITVLEDPERKRGVKEFLSRQMPTGQSYKERINQPSLTTVIDLEKVHRNYSSFRHFERALLWLTNQVMPELYPLRS